MAVSMVVKKVDSMVVMKVEKRVDLMVEKLDILRDVQMAALRVSSWVA